MNVDFAFLCDSADISGPKINARGIGFDELYAPEVPWTPAEFWCVVQLSANLEEVGERDLHIELIDADGGVVAEFDDTFTVERPAPGEDAKARLGVAFTELVLPGYGDYSLHLVVDGHPLHSLPIVVSPPRSAAGA